MAKQVIMPQLGESVVEGTLTKWLKAPGDSIQEYEPLLEINTDKVDSEIPSPASGVLLEILVPEGKTVHAGELLAWIGDPGEVTRQPEDQPVMERAGEATAAVATPGNHQGHNLGFISPVVSKIAQEHAIDLFQVKGTGQGRRITKKDILAFIETREAKGAEVEIKAPVQIPPSPPEPIPGAIAPAIPAPAPGTEDEVLPLTTLRRAIAEHMVSSERTSPHVTTVVEADLSRVVAHREANKPAFARDGVNLTFTAYFVAAAVKALKADPLVNSSWGENGILVHRAINIGIATSLGRDGLIVPVIKNADALSLLGLARAINDLAARARLRQLQPDEVKGGSFTITNHGISGSLFATPIINQPQCAILGVGVIQKRVIVASDSLGGDTIAIRPMVYLSLTFDHRILDGASADEFLAKVVESLQNWDS